MVILIIYALVTLSFFICLVPIFVYETIKKRRKSIRKIMSKSGCFWPSDDCRHPREYMCIKCGDCGRKFIK